jgi:hypothetical protein
VEESAAESKETAAAVKRVVAAAAVQALLLDDGRWAAKGARTGAGTRGVDEEEEEEQEVLERCAAGAAAGERRARGSARSGNAERLPVDDAAARVGCIHYHAHVRRRRCKSDALLRCGEL